MHKAMPIRESHANDANIRSQELIHPELSYRITGLCFKVHNALGRFGREKQYADKLEELLKENNVLYQREIEINTLTPESPSGNRADFIIENKVILDTKAKKFITKDDYNQMLRYLQACRLKLGLIVNFRTTYLKPKRVLNYSHNSHEHS